MDDVLRYVTIAFSIIQERRAAGFPVARELLSLIMFIANTPAEITPEMWAEHDAAQEASRELRRNAQPRDGVITG